MNEEDLRDCFAMFALAGAIIRGEDWRPKDIWTIDDDMIGTRKPKESDDEEDVGIARVAPKRNYRRKS
jgi:hypothetical protein